MYNQQQMQQQKAALPVLDTDNYYDDDDRQLMKNNSKNILSQVDPNKRENTQFTQSTSLSHHILPGCGVGAKLMTQQSITNQSIPNLFTDNSISSKNIKDDQSETLYLTTQQSPRNFASQEQQQYSSMSQFQYICQKFQLKMEDIMQIMQGFQDKEIKRQEGEGMEETRFTNTQNYNLGQKPNNIDNDQQIQQYDKFTLQNQQQFTNQLLVPSQNQTNIRYQSEISQTQSLNEDREQEEQQFSQQTIENQINGNLSTNKSNQSRGDREMSHQQSQDMPLQYNPYDFKAKSISKQQISTQLEIQDSKTNHQNNLLQSQKSLNYLNNSINSQQQNNIQQAHNHQNSSQFSYQMANKSKNSSMMMGENQVFNASVRLQNELASHQQLSMQSQCNSRMNEHNQKSEQFYETSQDNYQDEYQGEDNYSQGQQQSIYSENSEQEGCYIAVRCGNRDDIQDNSSNNNKYLENDQEDFSCPIQFFNGGFVVYSINNCIKNIQENHQPNEIENTPEIVLFTSQSDQTCTKANPIYSSNSQNNQQDYKGEENNQQEDRLLQQNNRDNFMQRFNNQFEDENDDQELLDDCQHPLQMHNQSEQKIDTQRSNQVFIQNDEISFTNQTFENRISRRLSEKTYLSNEYIQTDKQTYASSQEPQYTQEKLEEEEEEGEVPYNQQQLNGDEDYQQLENLRKLTDGNYQIKQFSNRQSQLQKLQLLQNDNTKTSDEGSNQSSQQQHGMSIKEMKMRQQYQDPYLIQQANFASFNNSGQIYNSYGYQSEEQGEQNNQQHIVHELEDEYQSEQIYFQQQQQQQQQVIQGGPQINNNFMNSNQQSNNNSHKNSQQQFGLESFGDLKHQNPNYPQQFPSNQYQREESFNDQISQSFSQQNPSQNYDTNTSQDGYLNPHFANGRNDKQHRCQQDSNLQSYYQNSTSMDQSQQGSSAYGNYQNQSNNSSYHNHATLMLEKYVEEIKRLQQENQQQKLEIVEINGKLQGVQESKKDFELIIQSLKQNLECVTGLLKKKEEDYNLLFEKYFYKINLYLQNNIVESIHRSESKNKQRREISPSHSFKESNIMDSYDRHSSRQQDLRSSCGKENRNSQERAILSQRQTESPKNILSQRDINNLQTLEKQSSKRSLNHHFENPTFTQFKPPIVKNPKKLIQYDENNRRTLKRENSENNIGQKYQQPQFVPQQTMQKITQNVQQLDLKKDKENLQKYSRKTSLSPNQLEEKARNNNKIKSPRNIPMSGRVNDENLRYHDQIKHSTKRENLTGNRVQDSILGSSKAISSSQTRYSDQFKKQKSYQQVPVPNYSQQDKQVIDELRNFCFRKKQ